MATTQSIPAEAAVFPAATTGAVPAMETARAAAPATPPLAVPAEEPGRALVPAVQPAAEEAGPLNGAVARLPVELDVVVPVEEFRVRDLLALEAGSVIASRWNYGEDVPLAAGEVHLAWSEFEVIDGQLGVRITRLP